MKLTHSDCRTVSTFSAYQIEKKFGKEETLKLAEEMFKNDIIPFGEQAVVDKQTPRLYSKANIQNLFQEEANDMGPNISPLEPLILMINNFVVHTLITPNEDDEGENKASFKVMDLKVDIGFNYGALDLTIQRRGSYPTKFMLDITEAQRCVDQMDGKETDFGPGSFII